MDELNPLPGRKTHRLNLDSDQQQQREQEEREKQEQYQRIKQEKRKRKQQKQKAKEEKERMVKEESERKILQLKQEVQKYNTTAILFQPDSDSGVSFTRLRKKIQFMFPNLEKRKMRQSSSSSEDDQSQDDQASESEASSESESGSESEAELSPKKKQKKEKKVQKSRREQSQSDDGQQRRNKNKGVVKVEEMSAKDKLVQEVAVRWNYALSDWPPKQFDYQSELKKKGYRAVQFSKFKNAKQVVDGLIKVHELDGYQGVYRCKTGLIDVRPKGECPSLNYFYSKSEEELNQLLRKALNKQIELLQQIQYKQQGEEQLLQDLKRRQRQLIK